MFSAAKVSISHEPTKHSVNYLGSVIERFPNGNVDWQYDHRTAKSQFISLALKTQGY
jgi:hypothetical protein